MKKKGYSVSRGLTIILVLTIILLVVAVISVNSGKMSLSPSEVFNVLLGKGTAKQNLIVYDFRLPRIVLTMLVLVWEQLDV